MGRKSPLTHLKLRDEMKFQIFYDDVSRKNNLNPDPDAKEHYYDYRGAWKAGAKPDSTGHWPSKYKLEGHPRMIIDGVNTKTGKKVDEK